MVELRASIGEFRAKMAEARGEVAKLEAESRTHMAKFQAFGKAAALGVAAGVVVIGVESVKMAGEFQTATSVLQTAAGESASGLKVVRAGILDIAKSTGTTWQNLAEGMYQVEKAGYRGADGLKILRAAAQGAKEENASLDVVTNAMTSVMASYNIPASKAVQVMNALKTAAAGSKDTMQNYAASLSTVLPIASAAHISFAQLGGALAALTRHGTTAHEATQELNGAIRGLLTPLPAAQKAMAQLGISSVEVTQKLGQRGVTGSMEYLTKVIAQHTKGGLVQIGMMRQSASATDDLKKMMDQMTPAAKAMASDLMNNTVTVKDYRKEIGHLDPAQAAMARQFATLALKAKGFSDEAKAGLPVQTTMEAQLRKMTGGAVGLQTALMLSGSSTAYANDMTKRIGESMNNASKEVEGWHQTQGLFNTRMDRFKQTIDVLAIQIGTKLIPVLTGAMDWMGKHKGIMEGLALVLGGVVVVAIGAFVVAWVAAASWIYAVVAAVSGVVVGLGYLYTHFKIVREVVGTVVKVLRTGLGAAFAWIKDTLLPDLRKAWDSVWSFMQKPVAATLTFVRKLLADFAVFWKAHGAEIMTIATHIWNAIKTIVTTNVRLILDFVRPAMVVLGAIFRVAWDLIKGIVQTAWHLISGIVRTGLRLVMDIIGLWADLLTGHWSRLWGDLKKYVGDAIGGVYGILRTFAGDALGVLLQAGKDLVWGLIHGIGAMGGALGTAVSDMATGALNTVKSIFGINSPSRVFHEIGMHVGQGLVNGLDAHKGLVAASAAELARMATVSAAGTLSMAVTGTGPSLVGGRSGSSGAGRSGAAVIDLHVHLDGREIHRSVQTHELQYQGRNPRPSTSRG